MGRLNVRIAFAAVIGLLAPSILAAEECAAGMRVAVRPSLIWMPKSRRCSTSGTSIRSPSIVRFWASGNSINCDNLTGMQNTSVAFGCLGGST